MAISQTAEYALRAVVWLAQRPGEPQTTQQLADATHVSASYLPKVLQPLIRCGLVSGQRGLGGGYTLERDPAGVTVLDVVNCVEPMQRITSCPLKIASHGSALCPLHRLLDDTLALVEQRYASVSIHDLVHSSGGIRPLCVLVSPTVQGIAPLANRRSAADK